MKSCLLVLFIVMLGGMGSAALAQEAAGAAVEAALPPVMTLSPKPLVRGQAQTQTQPGPSSPAGVEEQGAASPASPAPPPLVFVPPPSSGTGAGAFNGGSDASLRVGDLWDRIRAGFAMPDLVDGYVTNREQWYAARPDYIERMTERSKKYLYYIVEEVEARKMPLELALLPFIESAYNPNAVSSASAAGMWQFIPSTARGYSLRQNLFRDDRRDVLASTRAALDYLQRLYAMFNDWHLALAAYNWGEGSVSRAIAKNQRLGLPTSYSSLSMPVETRYYVPKLQAIKNIVLNSEQFNLKLHPIDNHPYFRSVPITRDIDVALAAKLAKVPLADFKALNPSLSRPVIVAAGTPQVLMPWDNADIFSENLASYSGQLATWKAWVVPAGLGLKEAAQHVGLSEESLREVNGIGLRAGMIKAGSILLVPRSTNNEEDVGADIADNGQLTLYSLRPPRVMKTRAVAGRFEKTSKFRAGASAKAALSATGRGSAALGKMKTKVGGAKKSLGTGRKSSGAGGRLSKAATSSKATKGVKAASKKAAPAAKHATQHK